MSPRTDDTCLATPLRTAVAAVTLAVLLASAVTGTAVTDDVTTGQSTPTVTLSEESAAVGESVTVTLRIDSPDVAGYLAAVSYDPDAVTLESIEGADLEAPVANHDAERGWVNFTQSRPENVGEAPVVAARLTFTVESKAGTSLELGQRTVVSSEDGEDHDVQLSHGAITVEDGTVEDGDPGVVPGGADRSPGDDGGDDSDGTDGSSPGSSSRPEERANGSEQASPASGESQESASDDNGSEDDSVPGFGLAAGIVASFLAATALSRRR